MLVFEVGRIGLTVWGLVAAARDALVLTLGPMPFSVWASSHRSSVAASD